MLTRCAFHSLNMEMLALMKLTGFTSVFACVLLTRVICFHDLGQSQCHLETALGKLGPAAVCYGGCLLAQPKFQGHWMSVEST